MPSLLIPPYLQHPGNQPLSSGKSANCYVSLETKRLLPTQETKWLVQWQLALSLSLSCVLTSPFFVTTVPKRHRLGPNTLFWTDSVPLQPPPPSTPHPPSKKDRRKKKKKKKEKKKKDLTAEAGCQAFEKKKRKKKIAQKHFGSILWN